MCGKYNVINGVSDLFRAKNRLKDSLQLWKPKFFIGKEQSIYIWNSF
jgi:hypothetical protein